MEKGAVFKILRDCMGLSQREMAEKCDISKVYWSELESGKKVNPSEETLSLIAGTCGIHVEVIYALFRWDEAVVRKYLLECLEDIVWKQAN